MSRTIEFEQIVSDDWPYTLELYRDFQQSQTTDKTLLDRIVGNVFPASMDAFKQAYSEEFYADVREHVRESDVLLICRLGEHAVGFASFKDHPDVDTLYLGGIAIHGEHHGQHIARRAITSVLERINRSRIACTTQNPRVYELACLLSKRVLPEMGVPIPEEEQAFCSHILRGRPGTHNMETSIVTNLYSTCMYPSLPISKNTALDRWFCKSLRVDQSRQTRNGMLVVGILK